MECGLGQTCWLVEIPRGTPLWKTWLELDESQGSIDLPSARVHNILALCVCVIDRDPRHVFMLQHFQGTVARTHRLDDVPILPKPI